MANRPPTPRVPIQTPVFETNPDGTPRLTRTWIIFLEQLTKIRGGGPYIRTLLLKDTTVANNVADHVPIYQAGNVVRVIGVLRRAITANLTVRVNMNGHNLVTMTIPKTKGVDQPVVAVAPAPENAPDLAVLSWDVLASDGSIDAAGVASFTVEWQ